MKHYLNDLKPGTRFRSTKGEEFILLDTAWERPGSETWAMNTKTFVFTFFGFRSNDAEWRHVEVVIE